MLEETKGGVKIKSQPSNLMGGANGKSLVIETEDSRVLWFSTGASEVNEFCFVRINRETRISKKLNKRR